MQLFKPAPRALAAAPVPEATVVVHPDAASALFGTRKTSVPAAANYALKGIVVARKSGDSVAILAVEGKPAQALRVGAEVVPGVTVKEVHPQFVLLSEGGSEKRVDLPEKPSEMIAQGVGQPRASGTAETRAPPPEMPSAASETVRPHVRQPRANRRAEARNPAGRAESE